MVVIDTNVAIEYLKGNADIAAIVDSYAEKGGVAITAINRYELLQRVNNTQPVLSLISEVNIYDFDERASDRAAEMWHTLKARGKVVDDLDLLIASIAASNGETLVTMDKSFRHIDGDIVIISK